MTGLVEDSISDWKLSELRVTRTSLDRVVWGGGLGSLIMIRVVPTNGYFETGKVAGMVNERIFSGRTWEANWHGGG
jgi:hypothetical protein